MAFIWTHPVPSQLQNYFESKSFYFCVCLRMLLCHRWQGIGISLMEVTCCWTISPWLQEKSTRPGCAWSLLNPKMMVTFGGNGVTGVLLCPGGLRLESQWNQRMMCHHQVGPLASPVILYNIICLRVMTTILIFLFSSVPDDMRVVLIIGFHILLVLAGLSLVIYKAKKSNRWVLDVYVSLSLL